MSVEEAKAVLVRCLRVLFYRDCRSLNRFQIGVVSPIEDIEAVLGGGGGLQYHIDSKFRLVG